MAEIMPVSFDVACAAFRNTAFGDEIDPNIFPESALPPGLLAKCGGYALAIHLLSCRNAPIMSDWSYDSLHHAALDHEYTVGATAIRTTELFDQKSPQHNDKVHLSGFVIPEPGVPFVAHGSLRNNTFTLGAGKPGSDYGVLIYNLPYMTSVFEDRSAKVQSGIPANTALYSGIMEAATEAGATLFPEDLPMELA